MKNGCPKRKVVVKPIAVSAGTLDLTAARGRASRPEVKWPSFTFLGGTGGKKFRFTPLIFNGPSMPFAELPEVGTSKVWFSLRERSKLYEALRLLAAFTTQSYLPSSAVLWIGCLIDCPSFCCRVVLKKFSNASRWQSGFAAICASSLPSTGGPAVTGHAVVPC